MSRVKTTLILKLYFKEYGKKTGGEKIDFYDTLQK